MRLGKCMYSREWIRNPHRNTAQYMQGVRYFIKFAKYHSSPSSEICSCPCKKCRNGKKFDFKTVEKHLIIYGMDPTYDEWFFHGESDMTKVASLEQFKNDPMIEALDKKKSSMVEKPDKKKCYHWVADSNVSAKQVKESLSPKSNANRKDREELLIRVKELQNQIDDAVKSMMSMQRKHQNLQQAMQHKQLGSNMKLKTEASCSTQNSFIGNQNDNAVASTVEVESSSNGKQYVMLLSRNLAEVAKGFLETCTKCDGLEVVHNEEKIVCVTEVIDPEAPVFDWPQNGKYKLCEIGNGGHVIWPMYRLRIL